jgi:hypothetical protein
MLNEGEESSVQRLNGGSFSSLETIASREDHDWPRLRRDPKVRQPDFTVRCSAAHARQEHLPTI